MNIEPPLPQDDEAEREAARRKVLNRLKRARGQLDAVIRAVEEEKECRDVVTQLAAVNSALQRAGFAIISGAMRDCLNEDDTREKVGELERLFLSLA